MANENNIDKASQEIIRRLDVLIGVLLETGGKKGTPVPMGTRIRILSQMGMRPTQISKTLGRKLSYVSKELLRLRKAKAI